ncbi:MAG: hypothetical protein EON89_14625 [Brevundimonas sp.]|nr:MAG: hypothetical protein EON89_14625 [Brevundimonas sp.]
MAFAAAAITLALAGQEPQAPVAVLPEVVARGRVVTPQVARSYVERVAGAPLMATSLATWQTPICIETVNLQTDAALVFTSQIAARAAALGVETATRGCRPNVALIGTSDGRYTAGELVSAYPQAFTASSAATQGDSRDLQRFVESDAPVRWWTISAEFDTATHAFAEVLWDFSSAPMRDTTGAVFFNETLVRAMVQTIVIVDATRTDALSAETLGDYLAMVVLAEINPDGDLQRWPSVLSVWREGGGVSGMTTWDKRYLCALYEARVRQPGAEAPIRSRYQLGEIARRMAEAPGENGPAGADGCF